MIPSDASRAVDAIYRQINQTQAHYPDDTTICALFEAQVRKTPDDTAALANERSLTYRELDERANQVAHALHARGVGRQHIVGIMVERSLEMLIGIFGIIKSGAAYLPIAVDSPIRRVEFLVRDSRMGCLLVHERLLPSLAGLAVERIALEDQSLSALPTDRLDVTITPSDLIYVIYTSGSTGEPKGVMVEHGSVVNRLHWMQRTYPISAADTILQKTPFIFDVSVWELFWWAISGARLSLLGPGHEKFPQAIIEAVHRHQVSVIHFVPSMLNAFLNYLTDPQDIARLSGLRRVFCSGEALLPTQANRFYAIFRDTGARLTNLYGPTEATVDVSFYDCPIGTAVDSIPIGKPIDNTSFYIVRDGELQPIGQTGELYIGGVGLARGYLNRPALTAERFIPNPFVQEGLEIGYWRLRAAQSPISNLQSPISERLYRTGDLARYREDGNVEYLGRIDDQIKIRGLRIELGEIEATLCRHGSIEQAVVLLKHRDTLNPQLVAYVLTHDRQLTGQAIRQFLKDYLPDYMIPNAYMLLGDFPLTLNGKIDRQALANRPPL